MRSKYLRKTIILAVQELQGVLRQVSLLQKYLKRIQITFSRLKSYLIYIYVFAVLVAWP